MVDHIKTCTNYIQRKPISDKTYHIIYKRLHILYTKIIKVDHINTCNKINYPINSSRLTASIISLIS